VLALRCKEFAGSAVGTPRTVALAWTCSMMLRSRPCAGSAIRLAWLFAVVVSTGGVLADDRVTVQPRARGTGEIGATGRIEDYTGTRLVLREGEGRRLRVFTADEYRILGIETSYHPAHAAGSKLLGERRFAQADEQLRVALDAEQRRWVRREILALIVRADLASGRRSAAGAAFLKLVESDPTTPWFRLIPLWWTAGSPPDETRLSAREWLRDAAECARLMGASLLLDDPTFAVEAENALRLLARSDDTRYQALATAQLWRLELLRAPPGDAQVKQWAERAERMPADLRGGPLHVVGRARVTRHDHELAAAAFLWEPLQHADDPELCGRGLLEAGRSLAATAQETAALSVWAEIRQRFPDSEWARESETLERELRKSAR
jgi:hypothetical protein